MSCPTLMLEPCLGETFRLRVLYKDPDQIPIDITGWTIRWTLTAGNAQIIYTLPPNVETDPTLGQIDLMLTTAQVAALEGVTTYYKLTGTDNAVPAGEGDVDILEGRIRVG